MATQSKARPELVVSYERKDDQIVFIDKGEDRFVATVEDAIQTVRQGLEARRNIRVLLREFCGWVDQQAPQIAQAWIGLHGLGFRILVVSKKTSFDWGMSDSLSDLKLKLFEECPEVSVETLVIPDLPEDDIQAFMPDNPTRVQPKPHA